LIAIMTVYGFFVKRKIFVIGGQTQYCPVRILLSPVGPVPRTGRYHREPLDLAQDVPVERRADEGIGPYKCGVAWEI